MTIGESIRKVREEKGYSRERLARAARIEAVTIFNWEHGICFPNVMTLCAVADVLKISLDELVGRSRQFDNGVNVQSENVTDINVGNNAEWISVKERMPEKFGLYLIVHNGKVQAAYRQAFLIFGAIWNDDMSGGFSIIPEDEVTHWQPLPEPPKTE